ncbi:helicase-exonuclease AddAB subunit AddA [Clostridiales bacterium COT073_COT-073]|nr:helicase-exonuclease AddAB subunit AddA [Clostridiales bacterium COT073_COT-073]
MAFSYTKQQQSVIDVRNRNVLVAAAAGSGKTAVLVERVIQMVLNQEISMDQLLVVTFTRAAASEMRERISDALNKALSQKYQPEIREQLALLPSADITTIHSFCLKVIRENYSLLGLEPDFRIGEEAEIEILAEEAMSELLEAEYEAADNEFLHFARSFSGDTGDEPVETILRRVYSAAQGMALPEQWLDFVVSQLTVENKEDLKKNSLFQILWQELAVKLTEAQGEWEILADFTIAPELSAFQGQTEYFGNCLQICRECLLKNNYDGIVRLLRTYEAPAMPRNRKGIEPQILAEVKQKIENLRNIFLDLQPYFQNDLTENLQITQNMYRLSRELRRLVLAYEQRFQEKKQKQSLIDFNDIEHMALQLLRDENGKRTEIAERYRHQYRQVIIDEYQDTNEVQDSILELVSGVPERPNSFMVGDIKQSIYKFRQARPEIFQKKYLTYGDISSDYAKIDMQTNFRSRPEVLKLVNYVFRSIMTMEAAGINYDDSAKFVFPQIQDLEENYRPKLLLIEKESYQTETESVDRETLEAEIIAREIISLLDSEKPVYDKKTGVWRPVQIEDIAILMRSPSKAPAVYAEVFLRHGLPLMAEEGKAYFMTSEVKTLTDFLKTIDNPRDDLALLGVLCSVIFEFEPVDLARIKIETEAEFYFEALRQYHHKFADAGETPISDKAEPGKTRQTTWQKVDFFLKEWTTLKEAAYTLTISELIDLILERSYYSMLVALQPNGKQRTLNLQAFVEQIRLFEEKEKSNLFRFLKLLEKIKSLDLSFGQPVMEVSKAVRIMSIHKSKGLEFPVVFLAQLGKAFNIRDITAPVVLKEDYGIVLSDIDYQNRIVRESFHKPILKTLLRREILEEEQRLLYVALTRAREYLYLVGTVRLAEKAVEKWEAAVDTGQPYEIDGFFGQIRKREYLLAATSYLDFMMPALLTAAEYGLIEQQWVVDDRETATEMDRVDLAKVEGGEQETSENQGLDKEIGQRLMETESDAATEIEENTEASGIWRLREYQLDPATAIPFYPDYPYPELVREKITTSVSEEKQRFTPEDMPSGQFAAAASVRGSLYHKVLAILPWQMTSQELPVFLQSLVNKKMITAEELGMIDERDLTGILQSQLWQRMQAAAEKSRIKREQPFILAIPLHSGQITEQKMLQGVIDVFFEEDGALVLVDYKTDRLSGSDKQAAAVLQERYGYQMKSYRQALEMISGLPVKESYLYSISRQMAVLIEKK